MRLSEENNVPKGHEQAGSRSVSEESQDSSLDYLASLSRDCPSTDPLTTPEIRSLISLKLNHAFSPSQEVILAFGFIDELLNDLEEERSISDSWNESFQ